MEKIKTLIVVFVSLWAMHATAQNLPADVCTVKNGDLVFNIDLRWDASQQKQLIKTYDLDSTMVAGVFAGKRSFKVDGELWEARKKGRNYVILQKPVQRQPAFGEMLLKFLYDQEKIGDRPGYIDGPVHFGFNKFVRQSVKFGKEDSVQFTLFDHRDAKEVYLSGSFNNWQTNELPLKQIEKGWKTTIKAEPGKYYYKFIADGRWMPDPDNLQKESDGVNDYNSVVFVPNHTFKLKGYQSAENVYVAGSFNGWKPHNAPMDVTPQGWELNAFVSYGKHTYKFVVDGKWILDPANPDKAENQYGTGNSVLNIGESYQFVLPGFPNATNVFLAGSFNNWNPNEIQMSRTDSGWIAEYYFGPGNYEYKFIVDGQWMLDPDNPKVAHSGGADNSLLVYKPNHTFVLKGFDDASLVIVTGTFNDWSPYGYEMIWRNNRWELDLYLPKGKISYKFIVDNNWIPDPANPVYETNQHGTYNSVLWKE